VYRNRPPTLNELKTAITGYIRNISQADLQKVFANKINTLRKGDADLRFYITTVQDG